MKKLFALLLAVIMVVALAAPACAAKTVLVIALSVLAVLLYSTQPDPGRRSHGTTAERRSLRHVRRH